MRQSLPATILITGSNGQLGSELRDLSATYPQYRFLFTTHRELPIEDKKIVSDYFSDVQIDYCINCAAYTAVDKAETDQDLAFLINSTAAGELSTVCDKHRVKLIHISTDYVYDGTIKEPLKEIDAVAPLNVYGWSKLKGDELVVSNNPDAIIIRTSWVYSSYGHNFLKTILKLLTEKNELNIVADQIGCPTYAADLAKVIMLFIEKISSGEHFSGIYNYSNSGITSWFQFAQYIKERTGSACELIPVSSGQYPTTAKRPLYSVLDTTKIKTELKLKVPFWKDSVAACIEKISGNH